MPPTHGPFTPFSSLPCTSRQVPLLRNWTGYASLTTSTSVISPSQAPVPQASPAENTQTPVVHKRNEAYQFRRAIVEKTDRLSTDLEGGEKRELLTESLPFSQAAEIWLGHHKQYIKPATYKCYRQYANSLAAFFREMPIGTIKIGDVRAYQSEQQKREGPIRINGQMQSVLRPILKEIDCWDRIAQVYRSLPVPPKRVRQNMSEEQERRLVAIALDSSKPCRILAGHCLVVMANTSMGFGELSNLKREDVFLNEAPPVVTVNGGTKNDFRIRTIPLNWLALRSMRWIVKRWEELGGSEPGQYILPHRATRTAEQRASRGHDRKSPPDFTRPMGHIYKAARAILKEAGLEGFVPYDMRSTFGTKLLKDPNVSDQTFREIFGHSNTRTRDRYSHQQISTKKAAVDRLCLEQEPEVKLIAFPGGLAKKTASNT